MKENNNILYFEGLLTDYFSDNLNLRGKAFDAIRNITSVNEINQLLSGLEKYFVSHNLSHRNLSFDIYIFFKENSVEFLEEFLTNKDKDIRKVSAELLIAIDSKKSVDKIIPLIEDIDINVRYSAIEAVGKLGNYNQIPYLYEAFHKLPDYKCALLSAISDIGGENSEEMIFEVLKDAKDIFLKMCAIDSISRVGKSEEVLYYLVEDIQSAEDDLMPIYLKAIYNVATRMGLDFEIPDSIRHIVYNSLTQNDEEYLLYALKLIKNDIRQEDLEYFNSKFLITNPKIRNQLIQNIINVEDGLIYSLLMNKISHIILELYSFEEFTLDILDNLKQFEINSLFDVLERNLKFLIDFVLGNETINYILILESISDSFTIQAEDILFRIKKKK